MNNVYWGWVSDSAVIMAPGATAGEGRCEAGEWGLIVEDVVVYGSVRALRAWAGSALARLPQERGAAPLVTVDAGRQRQWLGESGVLGATTGPAAEWEDGVESVHDVLRAVAVDPGAAGWILGDDVAALWADIDDDDGGLIAGVVLSSTGHAVGIGQPLTRADLTVRVQASPVEQANACLAVVAERINNAY